MGGVFPGETFYDSARWGHWPARLALPEKPKKQ